MMKRNMYLSLSMLTLAAGLSAAEPVVIQLPEARRSGGMPLMDALSARRSTRSFKKDAPIADAVLGELLWATWGYNREDKRTAPTAVNAQELDVYVLRADGAWLYDARKHALIQVVDKDIRSATLMENIAQPFVLDAPVTLVYVCDTTRGPKGADGKGIIGKWAGTDTGFLAQNAYLYCASAGLGTVVRGSFPPEALAKALKLNENQLVTLCQCVGWPQ
jgi:nitroreductase